MYHGITMCFGHGTMIISFEENNKEKKQAVFKLFDSKNPQKQSPCKMIKYKGS